MELGNFEASRIRPAVHSSNSFVLPALAVRLTTTVTGLEFWFTPTGRPPRYKMAAVTIAVITALLLTLFPPLEGLMQGLPDALQTLIGVSIMVLLMTYVVMPAATSALRPWLYRKS